MSPLNETAYQVKHGQIWSIAWPMILANVATTLIGLVDTAILGHLDDPSFIGGAAVATSLFNIIYMSLAFLRMGTTGLIAQHFGEAKWQNLYATLVLSSVLAFTIGLSLIISAAFIFDLAFPLIGGSQQVQDMAIIYANIRILSSPFVLFNFVALGFLIGVQRSRQALLLLMFSQGLNIALDFYLALHLGWNIAGIAWATVISDAAGSLLALYFIVGFLRGKNIKVNNFPETIAKLKVIFSLNRDIFFRTITLISIFAFITAQSARQGDVILAANSILIQIFFFLANAIDGFANAAESKSGEALGAHRKNGQLNLSLAINQSYSHALIQAFGFLFLALVLISVFSSTILGLLTDQQEILQTLDQYFG